MNVVSWFDQGNRLLAENEVESWYDNGMRISLPVGMSASVAAASPILADKALQYEADIAKMRARIDNFPKKEGTMFGTCHRNPSASKAAASHACQYL